MKLIRMVYLNSGAYSFQVGRFNSQTQEIEWEQVYIGTHASYSLEGVNVR